MFLILDKKKTHLYISYTLLIVTILSVLPPSKMCAEFYFHRLDEVSEYKLVKNKPDMVINMYKVTHPSSRSEEEVTLSTKSRRF